MGGPGWSGSSSSSGRWFPQPGAALHSVPLGPRLPSDLTLWPRRCWSRKRGRASAPCGQWGLSLGAGAWRPGRNAPSGGCFKMADVAGPSRPGAAAFWSRDCILLPGWQGAPAPSPDRGRAVAWDSGWPRKTRSNPEAGTC